MSIVTAGHPAITELCRALKIDISQVVNLTIRFAAGSIATITVERHVTSRDMDALLTAVEVLQIEARLMK